MADDQSGARMGFMLSISACLVTEAAFAADAQGTVSLALIAVTVDYPPGAQSPSHRHAKSAFITGYVLSGAIRSQVDDSPVNNRLASIMLRARCNLQTYEINRRQLKITPDLTM